MSRAGWILCAGWSAVLIVWGFAQPEPYAEGWRLVVELAFLGRLLNVADGIHAGFSKPYLLVQSGLQDIIVLLIVYPWAVSAYEGALHRRLIAKPVDTVRKSAERHKRLVEPFGAIGLWVFVFFPFWSTGVLVGGVVGYLLGMRTWVVMASVLSGHVISVVALIWFFEAMNNIAEELNSGAGRFLPWIVLGVVIGGAMLLRIIRRVRNGHAGIEN